jgi:predicted Zn-dependent protease
MQAEPSNVGTMSEKLDTTDAASILSAYEKLQSIDTESLYAAMYLQYTAGKLENAKRMSRALVMLNPSRVDFKQQLSQINYELGAYEDAMLGFRDCFSLNNSDPQPLFKAAEAALRCSQLETSKSYLIYLLSLDYEPAHDETVTDAQNLLEIINAL